MSEASATRQLFLSNSNGGTPGGTLRSLRWPLFLAGMLLAALLLYLPPYKTHFVGDDYVQLGYVAGFLQRPWEAYRVFNPFWTEWYYRPLQNVWMLACRLAFGLKPFPYYYLQGLWHLLTVSALFALARKVRIPRAGALAAALLFAINAHHHDVVSWISSVAIIQAAFFSFLAMAAYATYLRRPTRFTWLLIGAIFALLALFSHEEGTLLPPFLLVARIAFYRDRAPRRQELALGGFVLLAALLLGGVHYARPNLTNALGQATVAEYLSYLHPAELAHFLLTVIGRWLLLNKTVAGLALLNAATSSGVVELLLALALLLALGRWFTTGGNIVRLALFWAGMHLGFLYLAVWQQTPDFFAGRHLYSAWAGVSVALGIAVIEFWRSSHRFRDRKMRRRLLLSLLALILGLNALLVGDDQRAWQQRAHEVEAVARQMKRILPGVSPRTEIYAHRFVLVPSFAPHAAAVWYDEPGIEGGTLQDLQQRREKRVSPETVLFDYQDGELAIVAPWFQVQGPLRMLWQTPQATLVARGDSLSGNGRLLTNQVAGPPEDRRLALEAQPPQEGWLSLVYTTTVPAGSQLATDVWGPEGMAFRIRLMPDSGPPRLLSRTVVAGGGWQPLTAPLGRYAGQTVTLRLEVSGPPAKPAYWTIPRLVLE